MKQYTKQMLLFKDIFGKKVEIDFNGYDVTTDTGLLFLREVEDKTHIIAHISDVIRDNRHPAYVEHDIYNILKQRVFQIALGYEDCNDCDDIFVMILL